MKLKEISKNIYDVSSWLEEELGVLGSDGRRGIVKAASITEVALTTLGLDI